MTNGTWQDGYTVIPRMTRVVRALLVGTVAAFAVQAVADNLGNGIFSRLFGLSLVGMKRYQYWQLVTYLFVHGGFFHLFLNMLTLYFLGPETERAMGGTRFLILYLLSGMLGGVGWLFFTDAPWSLCVGASGALFGIIGAFAALFPHRPITLLVFFVLPVTMKAWVLAASLGGIELVFLLSSYQNGIAYAAHLAGGIAGYLYTLAAFRGGGSAWLARLGGRFRRQPGAERGEIDRILDKIAGQGIQSLTRAERDRLQRASRERGSVR